MDKSNSVDVGANIQFIRAAEKESGDFARRVATSVAERIGGHLEESRFLLEYSVEEYSNLGLPGQCYLDQELSFDVVGINRSADGANAGDGIRVKATYTCVVTKGGDRLVVTTILDNSPRALEDEIMSALAGVAKVKVIAVKLLEPLDGVRRQGFPPRRVVRG